MQPFTFPFSSMSSLLPDNTARLKSTGRRPALGVGLLRAIPAAWVQQTPTRDEVRIAPPADVRYQWVKVLDNLGRVVAQQQGNGEMGVISLSLKKLPAGLYVVQLFDGKSLTTQQVVKE